MKTLFKDMIWGYVCFPTIKFTQQVLPRPMELHHLKTESQLISSLILYPGAQDSLLLFYPDSSLLERQDQGHHQMDPFLPFSLANDNRNYHNSSWDQVLSHFLFKEFHFHTFFRGSYQHHNCFWESRGLHLAIFQGRRQWVNCFWAYDLFNEGLRMDIKILSACFKDLLLHLPMVIRKNWTSRFTSIRTRFFFVTTWLLATFATIFGNLSLDLFI